MTTKLDSFLFTFFPERLIDCVEQDDCTTHAFASESGCIGDLRGFYDEDEEAERGKGIVGQTYLAVRDTVEYINTMLYFYQVRANQWQGWRAHPSQIRPNGHPCIDIDST
jgi:hypothetical protein